MILATLCYVRVNGKTLMMHRNKRADDVHLGKYNGLGGKFEAGESPEECVIREVFEESSLTIQPRLRGVMTFPRFAKGQDWYCFLFTASEYSGVLRGDCPEGDLVWVANEKLLQLPLWQGDRIFLGWLDQPKFFSGKFVYEDGNLKDHSVVFYD